MVAVLLQRDLVPQLSVKSVDVVLFAFLFFKISF